MLYLRSPRLRLLIVMLVIATITVIFTVFSISRILNNASGSGSEVILPTAEFERLNDIYSKPLILPTDNAPSRVDGADTRVEVDLESSANDSNMSGTMTVNGQIISLESSDSSHETIVTNENDGSTAVDISINSDSTGTGKSQFDLQMNSMSEVYIDSEW